MEAVNLPVPGPLLFADSPLDRTEPTVEAKLRFTYSGLWEVWKMNGFADVSVMELEEVDGGFLNNLIGAAIGVAAYAATQAITGDKITVGGAVAAGVLGGLTSGASGFVTTTRLLTMTVVKVSTQTIAKETAKSVAGGAASAVAQKYSPW